MKIKNGLKNKINSLDIGDLLYFTGLILLSVGLYMHKPWIAPTVTGSIMILTGLFGKK